MERKDVPQNLKWKLNDVFESDEAWEKEYKAVVKEYGEYDFDAFKGKLADKTTLLEFLRFNDQVSRRLERLYLYATMRHHEDVRVSKNTAALGMIGSTFSQLLSRLAFVEPELTKLDDELLQGFIADSDFAEYEYALRKVVKSKAHVLSEAEEKLLALGSDVMGGFEDVFSMLNNANLNLPKASFNGEETQISHGMYGVVLRSGTAKERKEWFEKYYDAYIKLIDAITQTYSGNVKKNVFYKTIRGYESCMAMAMDGEDVQPIVYENLLETVHAALPSLHEYISLRKAVTGLEEQHIYDIFVPLVENVDIKLPFEEAYELVIEGLAPLGESYQKLLRFGKENGWIDVCETEGKRSGAYSTGIYGMHPYVLLNYYMEMFRATLFRQTQFAEFEQIAHTKAESGEALSKESLNEAYFALNKQYYGDGIIHDEQIAYEWARIPHFYSAFYVYKYATGIISAISIVKRILTEGESAVRDYFEFLSAGGSNDPVSILKKAGVDLTTKAPFEAAMREFKETLEEFKNLL